MSTWQGIGGPLKFFSGTSGVVHIPKGAHILHLIFQGGSVAGFPDGQGANVTITSPSNGPFIYRPMHEGIIAPAAYDLNFGGTTMYFVEVECKDGF